MRNAQIVFRAVLAIMLVGVAGLVQALRGSAAAPNGDLAGSTMALGFLFLTAFVVGRVASDLRLPKVTGYLLVGVLVGPEVLGLLTPGNLEDLALLNRLAVGLIALIAGGELRPSMLRERGRAIITILGTELSLVLLVVAALLITLRPFVPFLAAVPFGAAVALALVFASVAAVHSPAVTIAVLDEQRAAGPVATTTLGVVLAADVVVVLLVTLSLWLAQAALAPQAGFDLSFVMELGWELGGAILAGAVLGALVALYLRYVGAYLPLFIIFLALIGGELANLLHVEYMLFMLSAGFFVENVSPVVGDPLIEAIERVSLPVYALFFALAGASIHLRELFALWPIALLIVAARAGALWAGCRFGTRWANVEDSVRRYTWMGLVSQAGVALGLITVAVEALPAAGPSMRTLFLAMLALHEFAGPILFRAALSRAGEIGRRGGAAVQAAERRLASAPLRS